jgi:hypothetical protein
VVLLALVSNFGAVADSLASRRKTKTTTAATNKTIRNPKFRLNGFLKNAEPGKDLELLSVPDLANQITQDIRTLSAARDETKAADKAKGKANDRKNAAKTALDKVKQGARKGR